MSVHNSTKNLVAENTESFSTRLTAGTWALVKSGNTTLNGIFVSASNGGSIAIYDSALTAGSSISTVVCGTMTIASGERYINFGGTRLANGLLIYNLGSGNDLTVMFR
jgi:hypothetical protein